MSIFSSRSGFMAAFEKCTSPPAGGSTVRYSTVARVIVGLRATVATATATWLPPHANWLQCGVARLPSVNNNQLRLNWDQWPGYWLLSINTDIRHLGWRSWRGWWWRWWWCYFLDALCAFSRSSHIDVNSRFSFTWNINKHITFNCQIPLAIPGCLCICLSVCLFVWVTLTLHIPSVLFAVLSCLFSPQLSSTQPSAAWFHSGWFCLTFPVGPLL